MNKNQNFDELFDLLLRAEAMLRVRRSVLTEIQKDKINNQLNNLKQTLFASTKVHEIEPAREQLEKIKAAADQQTASVNISPMSMARKIIPKIQEMMRKKGWQSALIPALLSSGCNFINKEQAEKYHENLKRINEGTMKNVVPPVELEPQPIIGAFQKELNNTVICVVEEADLKGKVSVDTENDPSISGKPGFQVVTPAGYAKLQEIAKPHGSFPCKDSSQRIAAAETMKRVLARQSEDRVHRVQGSEPVKVYDIVTPDEAKKLDDIFRQTIAEKEKAFAGWQTRNPEMLRRYSELEDSLKKNQQWIQASADKNAYPIFPGEKVFASKTMGKSEELTVFRTEDGRSVPLDRVEWKPDGCVVSTPKEGEKIEFGLSNSNQFGRLVKEYFRPRNDQADALALTREVLEEGECDGPLIINQTEKENHENR